MCGSFVVGKGLYSGPLDYDDLRFFTKNCNFLCRHRSRLQLSFDFFAKSVSDADGAVHGLQLSFDFFAKSVSGADGTVRGLQLSFDFSQKV